MRDLLANARRLGLAALAATAVTLALAAVASGTIASRGGGHGGPGTTGAPATSGSADSTIVAQNGDPADNPPPTVVCPTCAFSITTTNLPTPVLNQVYAQTIVAAGGAAPITFTVSSGGLPAGLSLAPNGALIGTPTAPGGYSFTVKAADANGATDTQTYSGIITAILAITTKSLPTPVLNQAYDQTIAATAGAPPITSTVSSGSLPAGLSLAPNGALTGTPTAPGAYRFTIAAADANGAKATQTYSGTIGRILAITTASLPTPVLNKAYNQIIATSGGAPPISFSVSSRTLPAGLYLADGAIAGTPTAAGDYSFTVKVADANGATAAQTYSGTIAGIMAITTTSLPTPVLNQSYSQTIAASGGAAPISYTVSGGTLPSGLSLADGAIAGTPTAAGPYSFTVKAADAAGATATQAYSGTIAGIFAINTPSLPTPVLNRAYNQTIAAAGGAAPVSLSVSDGTLPAGLYLAGGAIAGTPTAAGPYNFTIKAADANGATATQTYSGTIAAALAIATTRLPTPVLSQPYGQPIAAVGGVEPVSFSISDGTLPAGLSLAGGAISGTPTAAGAYNFTIKAADTNGTTATQTYSGTIAGILAITTTSLPTPVLNQAYDQTIAVSGGGAPFSLTVSDGTLPAGLYLADGAIAGTPTAAGAYSFTIKAADAKGVLATQTYSGTIAGTFAITTASLPTPVLNQAYDQAIAVSGGGAPISLTVSGGSLPAGLYLADGAIAGTPTAAGPYSFTIKAADAKGTSATQTYSGSIAGILAITTTSLPTPVLNRAYSQAIAVSGGGAPFSLTVSDGTLPAGLYLADDAIAGTPTAAGAYSFTIKAADAKGTIATQAYSGSIAGILAITTTSLPTPVLNQAYSQAIAASGGAAPISLTVSDGTLPAGLALADGAIAGTPTAAGAYSFTIKAADAKGTSATQAYSGSIGGILAITTTSLPTPVLNQAYNQRLTVSDGAAPISFSVSGGALPAGMYLADGTIAGAPTAAGAYSFTIKAADANGAAATQTYSGTIPAALVAHSVTATIDYNSTNAPIALNISGGLVNGVTVVTPASHGVATANGSSITYTPTSGYAGSDSFQYTATGDAGASPPATVSIIVNSQAPVADAVSETVSYDSTNNAINLDVRGGQADLVAISTQPAHGKASASGTSISYTPTRGYSGSDSFQYTAADAAGESSPAKVSITVNPQAPIARGVRETVEVNSTNNEINLAIVGGPPDSVAVAAPATQGTATASGTSIIYSPGADFEGSDSFQYIAANAGGTSKAATVSVIVRAPAVSREARSRAVSHEAQGRAVNHEAQDPSVSHEARNRCAALDPDTSIAGCTELIQSGALRSTDLAITYNNRGMAYDAERQYDNAISDFSSAIGIESGVAEIYFNRGVAYDSKGLTDQAIADYGRAITLRPDDANAYIRRGVDYRAKSRTDQAIADFTQAIRLRPGGAEAYDDRAGAYSSKGAGDEAIADLTQAIALRPRSAQAYIDRAAIYMNKGLYDQSITDSTEAIALKPNDAGGYVNRAAAYIGKGVYSQAIADATRAIALEPDDALAYNNRAVADNFSALFDQAIDDATQAIALEPDYALAYLNRAIAEDARGRRDQTIADLRAALEIDPTLQKARDGLTHLGVTP